MGLCRLFDLRAGYSVASWKAHEGFITKLSTFNEYYLVSSSLDKTLCLWDIRRCLAQEKVLERQLDYLVDWLDHLDYLAGYFVGWTWSSKVFARPFGDVYRGAYLYAYDCGSTLRNGAAGKIQTFHGHKHGVSSFEIWGNSLLSSAGTRIGISTITLSASQDQELSFIRLHKLFSSELSNLGLSSSITTTSILPFSRFLLIGSDDGYLRVCK
ncbi:hypothetical protein KP509_1Z300000 [Ceratopteris richardii]|nr:hypothetical protein KP509_1Z300000 [Ceratopteris richardii]